jgi:hypothetical protein
MPVLLLLAVLGFVKATLLQGQGVVWCVLKGIALECLCYYYLRCLGLERAAALLHCGKGKMWCVLKGIAVECLCYYYLRCLGLERAAALRQGQGVLCFNHSLVRVRYLCLLHLHFTERQ